MNNASLIAAAIVAITHSQLRAAETPSISQSNAEIQAQINVTRDAARLVIEKLENSLRDAGSSFEHADFKRKLAKFKGRVETALESYELLGSKVVAEIYYKYVFPWRNVKNSEIYSEEQKATLLQASKTRQKGISPASSKNMRPRLTICFQCSGTMRPHTY